MNELKPLLDELQTLLRGSLQDQLAWQKLLSQLDTQVKATAETIERLGQARSDLNLMCQELREASAAASQAPPRQAASLSTRTTTALVLMTVLATVLAISLLFPGWTLSAQARRSLELGTLISEGYPRLASQEQVQLERLLSTLSKPPQPTSRR